MKKNVTDMIGFEEARSLSGNNVIRELGARVKYLIEDLGMDREEAQNFVASLINLGVAANYKMMETFSERS